MTSHSASQIKAMEGGDGMTRNLRMTGAVAASDARVLGDPNATGAERSAAASALAQAAHQARQTRAQAASDAARVLRDPAATGAERSAAGSALAQAPFRASGKRK